MAVAVAVVVDAEGDYPSQVGRGENKQGRWHGPFGTGRIGHHCRKKPIWL
jgi:hypothetical protein